MIKNLDVVKSHVNLGKRDFFKRTIAIREKRLLQYGYRQSHGQAEEDCIL